LRFRRSLRSKVSHAFTTAQRLFWCILLLLLRRISWRSVSESRMFDCMSQSSYLFRIVNEPKKRIFVKFYGRWCSNDDRIPWSPIHLKRQSCWVRSLKVPVRYTKLVFTLLLKLAVSDTKTQTFCAAQGGKVTAISYKGNLIYERETHNLTVINTISYFQDKTRIQPTLFFQKNATTIQQALHFFFSIDFVFRLLHHHRLLPCNCHGCHYIKLNGIVARKFFTFTIKPFDFRPAFLLSFQWHIHLSNCCPFTILSYRSVLPKKSSDHERGTAHDFVEFFSADRVDHQLTAVLLWNREIFIDR
jgi:hypothetical protein